MNLSISIKERFSKGALTAAEKFSGSNVLKNGPTSDEQLYGYLDDARIQLERAVLTFNELTDEKAIVTVFMALHLHKELATTKEH